jgi:Rieske Fe-S protein
MTALTTLNESGDSVGMVCTSTNAEYLVEIDHYEYYYTTCHGSHYHVTGEYLDGPAPRSLDRFALSFNGEDVVIDTGTLNNLMPPHV